MAEWDPDLYRMFEEERTRPARDLLARVDLASPREIVDLGCGPGNSTEVLAQRFPDAQLTGIDTSAAMLDQARSRLPLGVFTQADVATWIADRSVDLIFANAVLQWLPDHSGLMPRLFGMLAPGGVLAVQMPDNIEEPSHRLMREIAMDPRWRDRLDGARIARAASVLSPGAYYDLLAPLAKTADLWRTAYHHPMPSPAAIVDWLRATGLRPYLDPLTAPEGAAFLSLYEAAIDRAYPARPDGRRLLAFPRLFVVVSRPS